LQVLVRDNNVDQALRVLKKKMQREGLFREMKRRKCYEKPSERKNREKSEAIRRTRKLARKKAIREGSIPDTHKKIDDKKPGRPVGGDRGLGGGGARGGMGGPRPARL
jgi:small subunit ribosomal protein S21